MNEPPLLPRLVRFRDAPFYLGMDRNRFNAEVRPQLMEIPIGTQGIAFDRLELDAWVEQYKSRNGRPAQRKGKLTWDERGCPVLSTGVVSGTSTSGSDVVAFEKALAKATSQSAGVSDQETGRGPASLSVRCTTQTIVSPSGDQVP